MAVHLQFRSSYSGIREFDVYHSGHRYSMSLDDKQVTFRFEDEIPVNVRRDAVHQLLRNRINNLKIVRAKHESFDRGLVANIYRETRANTRYILRYLKSLSV